ncbi:MAG: peptidyl-alpha-hydroxyglycine alpha-amidating lyase family protein [Candidatus Bathyarchaeia archaeon]
MVFGWGKHVYKVIEGWGKHFYSPFVDVTGVGVDSKDRVYVFIRGIDPVLVFDSEGVFLKSWGRDYFTWPHGLYVGPGDYVYCTDGDHTVRKFTTDGKLLLTLGRRNQPSETGCVDRDYRTIKKAAGPFNCPTDVAIDKEGNLYVSDGYGNARIHKFSSDGELLLSWGEPGREPGQFNLPHGICVDEDGVVYVADRENSRIQLFDSEGSFLDQWEANRPTDLYIHDGSLYVTELGYETGARLRSTSPRDRSTVARLSIFTLDGELISRWGSEYGCSHGSFFAPHAVCVDSKGDIYVGEVVITSVGSGGIVPADCHTLQKFVRVRQMDS